MESVAAVGARISAIEARLASLAHPPAAAHRGAAKVPSTGMAAAGAGLAASLATTSTATAQAGSFAQALAAASAPALAPVKAATAPLTAAALKGYGNGRIPAASLTSIGGKERLWAPAAEAFLKMRDAARAQGVTLGVNDSYRSYEQQVDVAARKGLYSQGGLAAKPGTSDHGWGKALDLQLDGRAQAWMRTNGERFGFTEDTPREPWHWVFKA